MLPLTANCSMTEALSSTLLDANGSRISLERLLNGQGANVQRTLVVFIRHFFCGNCQEYVRRLATDLAPSGLPDDLSVIIVGCGASSLISSYRELTNCPFPLYADPTTRIHKRLGMQRSLSLGPKDPAYIQHSLASGMMKSVVQGLKRIPAGDVGKGGDLSVNGGELLFVRESAMSGWDLTWSHCMMNSRDHTEIDILRSRLQLENTRTSTESQQDEIVRDGSTATTLSACSTGSCHYIPQMHSENAKRSTSTKRRSWMIKAGHISRAQSFKSCIIHVS